MLTVLNSFSKYILKYVINDYLCHWLNVFLNVRKTAFITSLTVFRSCPFPPSPHTNTQTRSHSHWPPFCWILQAWSYSRALTSIISNYLECFPQFSHHLSLSSNFLLREAFYNYPFHSSPSLHHCPPTSLLSPALFLFPLTHLSLFKNTTNIWGYLLLLSFLLLSEFLH